MGLRPFDVSPPPERSLRPLFSPLWRIGRLEGRRHQLDPGLSARGPPFFAGTAAFDARPRAIGGTAREPRLSGGRVHLAVVVRRRDGRLEIDRPSSGNPSRIPSPRRIPDAG